tara:strand:- start:211 stop:837 length:627 start_codon:yes stop_codon:yes gene_type:complete
MKITDHKLKLITLPPRRTPAVISDEISTIIKDKVVCELGCAEGDNMLLMGRYAKTINGIDLNKERLKHAINRNLDVKKLDYRINKLPEADVYYCWPSNGLRDIPFLIWKIYKANKKKSIVIFGADASVKSEKFISQFLSFFFDLRKIKYDEGNAHRQSGVFHLNIIDFKKINSKFIPILWLVIILLRFLSFFILKLKNFTTSKPNFNA